MPSIEFLGYTHEEGEALKAKLKTALNELPFREQVMFVFYPSVVEGFDGSNQPYLRVSTRNEEKAMVLMQELKAFADVEYMQTHSIEFKQPAS